MEQWVLSKCVWCAIIQAEVRCNLGHLKTKESKSKQLTAKYSRVQASKGLTLQITVTFRCQSFIKSHCQDVLPFSSLCLVSPYLCFLGHLSLIPVISVHSQTVHSFYVWLFHCFLHTSFYPLCQKMLGLSHISTLKFMLFQTL